MNGDKIRKCVAEAIGTFWLTFAGCGSAVITAAFPNRHRPAGRCTPKPCNGKLNPWSCSRCAALCYGCTA